MVPRWELKELGLMLQVATENCEGDSGEKITLIPFQEHFPRELYFL